MLKSALFGRTLEFRNIKKTWRVTITRGFDQKGCYNIFCGPTDVDSTKLNYPVSYNVPIIWEPSPL